MFVVVASSKFIIRALLCIKVVAFKGRDAEVEQLAKVYFVAISQCCRKPL